MKLLIVIPHFNKIEYGVIDSYKRLGFDVYSLFFSVGFSKFNFYQRVKNKLGFSVNKYLERQKGRFNKRLLKKYYSIRPDIVYVVQGRWVDETTLKKFGENVFKVLYLWDMVSLFPEMKKTFRYYDCLLSFDKEDAERLKKQGYNSAFRPSGYDPCVYYPIEFKKSIDISFIGAMYQDRVEMLKKLISDFPCLKIELYGKYAHIVEFKKWLKWRFSKESHFFKNKNISKTNVNVVYNKSKIVLAIVRNNQTDGWSSRLPEILGSRAFQITNYYPSVEKEFAGSLVTYKDYSDLKEKISYYLAHEKERTAIAQKGYRKVSVEMTEDAINHILIDEYKKWKNGK